MSSARESQAPVANARLQPAHWSRAAWKETFGTPRGTRLAERWPDGVRIAVLLTFDTQGDVDAALPGYQLNTCFWADGKINFCDLTQRQYDTWCGVYRILEILRRYDVRATFPVTGLTAEWYPEVVEAIAADGHEIATHGYRHVPLFRLERDEELLLAGGARCTPRPRTRSSCSPRPATSGTATSTTTTSHTCWTRPAGRWSRSRPGSTTGSS